MSTVRILQPGENIIERVVEALRPRGADVDRSLVVFAGKRPLHFVRKRLAESRNAGFLSPAMLAYDDLIEDLARKLGYHASSLDPLDASALLFEIHRSQHETLGSHFATFEEFLPLGFRLFEEFEELSLANVSEKQINETIGGISFGKRHALAEYYKQFVRVIKEKNLLTRSMKIRLVAGQFDEIDWSEYRTMVFAGFYALTPVDQQLFRRFLGLEHVTMFFQPGPGLVHQLKRIDIEVKSSQGIPAPGSDDDPQMTLFTGGPPDPSLENVARTQTPRIHLYKAPDLHGQVFALSSLVDSLLKQGGPPDERTVIVLPSSEGLFPVVQQTLSLLAPDGYNISLGYPLSRTPLYAFLSSVLDLTATARDGSLQASAYQQLVLHPYVKNIRYGQRSDVTRVLFHAVEEILSRRLSTTVRLEDLESDEAILDRVVRAFSHEHVAISRENLREHLKTVHDLIVRPFLNPGTMRNVAERVIALIQVIGDRSSAQLHPLFRRSAERLIEIAVGIRSSLAADQTFSSPEGVGMFLRTYVGPQTVPFPGTPLGGLQVLGLLETRNLSFDRVIVLDATDSNIPGTGGVERLLPQGIRQTLGLETSQDREHLIEYYFDVLLNSAKEVHLFFREERNEEQSRFIQKLLWRREQETGGQTKESLRQVRYSILLANPVPGAVEKTTDQALYLKDFEFSAKALDMYLKCPLQFYYHYVLGLREREEVGEEVEQYAVGTIVHEILNDFFQPAIDRVLTMADLDSARMDSLTEKAFGKALGSNLKGASLLLMEQTAGRLREFLHDYQEQMIKEGEIEILGVEQTLSIIKDGHRFSGRVDRIERRGEKTFILDYKVRQDDTPYRIKWKKFVAGQPETWSESVGSVQLPLYALLYSELSKTPADTIAAAYIFLGRNQLNKEIETGISDEEMKVERYTELETVITGLAQEIKDPKRPFEPTRDQKKQCPRCPYQVMCGTQWAREGRW
ncbi:MAG: PD-(D/E)XK nuclease family protein [Bacteroidota bacterium]